MSIKRRTATINGEKIAYTYNTANRVVSAPSKGIEFTATCYDAAKTELAEALTGNTLPAETAQPTETAATQSSVKPANVFHTRSLTHELVVLGDGTHAPKCRNRPTKGNAAYSERYAISCNSCSGAHRTGTHFGA